MITKVDRPATRNLRSTRVHRTRWISFFCALVLASIRADVPGRDNKDYLMRLIAVYVAIVMVVGFFGVELGYFLERLIPALSVPIMLGLFFGTLIVGGPVAVYITERWLMPAPAN